MNHVGILTKVRFPGIAAYRDKRIIYENYVLFEFGGIQSQMRKKSNVTDSMSSISRYHGP